MSKLQSQIDYEYSIDVPSLSDSDFRRLSRNYRKFLKQPLELWMFVPCDESGNVLEEKSIFNTTDDDYIFNSDEFDKYQQAKERVLFEGFEIIKDKYKDTNREFIYLPITNEQVWRRLTYYNGKQETFFFNFYEKFQTIEDLIKYNLTLTETAIKQIRL